MVQKANGEVKVIFDKMEDDDCEVSTLSDSGSSRSAVSSTGRTTQSSRNSSFDYKNAEVNNWLFNFMNPPTRQVVEANKEVEEDDKLSKLQQKVVLDLEAIGIKDLLIECGIKPTASNIEIFDDVTIPVIVDSF